MRLLPRIYELDIALGTGVRKGEQYRLRRGDVDFKARVITLRDTKNKWSRTVPMIDDVVAAFEQLKNLSLSRKDRSADKPNPYRKMSSSPSGITRSGGDLRIKKRRSRISAGMICAKPSARALHRQEPVSRSSRRRQDTRLLPCPPDTRTWITPHCTTQCRF